MMSSPDDTPTPDVEAGLASGAQLVGVLMHAAVDGGDDLREAVHELSDDQARWALTCLAWWDAQVGGDPAGVRVVVDDAVLDALRAAATGGGFAAVLAAVRDLPEPELKAALANLVSLHVDLRFSSASAGMN